MSKIASIKLIISYVLLSIGIFMSFSFIANEKKYQTCKYVAIEVDHSNDTYFINAQTIQNILNNHAEGMVVGKLLETINLSKIEKLLKTNPYVDDVNAYLQLNGTLHLKISQRTPMVRVLNAFNESFYIDEKGLKMPFSNTSNHHLPVFTGFISERIRKQTDTLETKTMQQAMIIIDYFKEHDWVKSLFTQIYVNNQQEFELIPRLGNHVVLLGDATNFDILNERFSKLDRLYRNGFKPADWSKYSTINLKFKGQIVCTKK